MKSKKSLFISTIVMVLVLVLALSTATYAWFAMQETVGLSGLTVTTAVTGGWEIGVWTYGAANPYQSGEMQLSAGDWTGSSAAMSGSLDFSAIDLFGALKGVTGNGVYSLLDPVEDEEEFMLENMMWKTNTAAADLMDGATIAGKGGVVNNLQGFPYALVPAQVNSDFFAVNLAFRNADSLTKDLYLLINGTELAAQFDLAPQAAMAGALRIAIFAMDGSDGSLGAALQVWEPFGNVYLDNAGQKQFNVPASQTAIPLNLQPAQISHNDPSYLQPVAAGGLEMQYNATDSVETSVGIAGKLSTSYPTQYFKTTGVGTAGVATDGATDILVADKLLFEDVEFGDYVYIRLVIWFEGQDFECLSASAGGGLLAAFTFGTPA